MNDASILAGGFEFPEPLNYGERFASVPLWQWQWQWHWRMLLAADWLLATGLGHGVRHSGVEAIPPCELLRTGIAGRLHAHYAQSHRE